MLGFGRLSENQLQDLIRSCEGSAVSDKGVAPVEHWTGKLICCTGECTCSIGRDLITRDMAEKLAADKGLKVSASVTKKLDLLVVADPNTQSGQAKKARQYGIRIVHEPVFWRSLGVELD